MTYVILDINYITFGHDFHLRIIYDDIIFQNRLKNNRNYLVLKITISFFNVTYRKLNDGTTVVIFQI